MTQTTRKNQRRKVHPYPKRRWWERRGKYFKYQRTIYLGDTNMMGSVYYAQFWHILGEAREEYLRWFLAENLPVFLQSGLGLATLEVSGKYLLPLNLYDECEIRIQTVKLSKVRFKLLFSVHVGTQKCFEATMGVAAIDTNSKPTRLPPYFYEALSKLLVDKP